MAEKEYLQDKFNSHAILDSLQEGVFIVRDDQFLFVNKKFSDLLGRPTEKLLGSNWFEFIHADFLDHLKKEVRRLSRGEIQDQPIESRIVRPDGDVRLVLLSIARMDEYPGGPAGIGSVLDITDKKRVEDWLYRSQKFDAIGRLSEGIAHDFNNLLAVIYGNLVLLRDDLSKVGEFDRAEAINMTESALASATCGSTLIKQLFAFSRKQPLTSKTADIDEIVAKMANLLRRTLGTEINLIVQLRNEKRWMATLDTGQLESAILNLALNSRDAMAAGGVLTVETLELVVDDGPGLFQRGLKPGEYIMLCVSDTGCGMTRDVCERAFEPYFTTKNPDKGTGLGLSMVYGFAQQSGGHAEIYSEPGIGTTVKVYIPKSYS